MLRNSNQQQAVHFKTMSLHNIEVENDSTELEQETCTVCHSADREVNGGCTETDTMS